MGAELLMYPTAIGSEPPPAITQDSSGHWQRTMQGHAAANMVPVVASNRIGTEHATNDETYELTFYGHSFIADHTGEVVAQADNHSETVLIHEFDRETIRTFRDAWGIYRDRRPDLYQTIATLDGKQQSA
jgi:N-carbamoylputrescine amidase